jgi:predicted dehydrogenase
MNRRQFLKNMGRGALGVGAITAFPTIVPASVLGRGGRPSPSNRIVMASVGYGWMGSSNHNAFLTHDEVQLVATCDIYKPHLEEARDKANEAYGNKDCATYRDFRELFQRTDLDAVTIALPDHWHSIPAIMAAQRGFDIYAEKPLSHTLLEGRAMVNAVNDYGRIWQTGSWQRSRDDFYRAAMLVRNGRIGKVTHIDVGLPGGQKDFSGDGDKRNPQPPPSDLDYDMWLGPAPWEPYCPARLFKDWRYLTDYGGGMLMDWVGHHVDIAHWGVGLDRTGPITAEGTATLPANLWNTPVDFDLHYTYANGMTLRLSDSLPGGTVWHGENGKWIHVDRGLLKSNPSSILSEKIGPEEIQLIKSTDHYQNFIDSIKSRQETITPAEIGHRSASVGHLGMIALLTGHKLKWDPDNETFDNDPDATALLGRKMRSPWTLPV